MQPTVLISLSGGMDSTFVLWHHLLKHPEDPVLVHHINLRHFAEDRLQQEKQSVKRILHWLRQNDLTTFIYHESSFDYGDLPRIAIKDIQIVALFQSIILRTPKYNTITNVKLCWHLGEVNTDENRQGERVKLIYEALHVPPVKLEFPIANLSRKDMARQMPDDLLRLVSCCRKPHIHNRPCGSCKTCRELAEAEIPLL